MALQHFIRVFIDSDGTTKGDCSHYDGNGNATGADPIEPHVIASMRASVIGMCFSDLSDLADEPVTADPSPEAPPKPARKRPKKEKT